MLCAVNMCERRISSDLADMVDRVFGEPTVPVPASVLPVPSSAATPPTSQEATPMRNVVDLCPKQVIFNPPATIVYWEDGTKTVVKADNDVFSEEFGYAMACMRKIYGSRAEFKAQFKNAVRPQQFPQKVKKSIVKSENKPASLNQLLSDLAGDGSKNACTGSRTVTV